MAAIFSVPKGREPKKLTSMPVRKIFSSGCIDQKYKESGLKLEDRGGKFEETVKYYPVK